MAVVLAIVTVAIVWTGGAAADTISAGCLAGPGTATCFRPSFIQTGDPVASLPPVFVETKNAGAGIVTLSILSNAGATNQAIQDVEMNLNPAIDPTSLIFTFKDICTNNGTPASNCTTTPTANGNPVPAISLGANSISLPPKDIGNFDIGFDFQHPTAGGGQGNKFDQADLVEFTVTCSGANCNLFNASSFNFTQENGFRICSHVQNTGANGQGSSQVCGTPATERVPEPTTVSLLGLGLAGLAAAARRLQQKTNR